MLDIIISRNGATINMLGISTLRRRVKPFPYILIEFLKWK